MKTHRRNFIKTGAGVLALAAFSPNLFSAAPVAGRKLKKAIMYGTLGFPGSVLEKFQAVQAAGFAGVEPMSHMNQDEVVHAFEATGLKAASVCCSTHWKQPLSHPDPAVRAAGLEGLRQALRDAKRYGATSVLLVPGIVKDGDTYEDCRDRSIAEIRKVLPLAEELGVKLAIENVWNNFATTPEQAVAYLDAINSPFVGWHFDIGNAIKYSPPETWIPVLGKRILKVHVKEFSLTKKFAVKYFEGDNHWPAIMQALDAAGYQGWAITEQPSSQTKDADGLKDFSARLDKIIAS